jgi:hypothetical protein
LLDHIEIVVEDKRTRFAECANKIESGTKMNDEEIFRKITQPVSQVNCILTNLGLFLKKFTGDNDITAFLIPVKNGAVDQMALRSSPQKVDIGSIIQNTYIRQCISKRDIKVVEKADDGQKTHHFSKSGIGMVKSAVCYPVVDSDTDTRGVLLVASQNYIFKENESERYKLILETFCTRIKLELELKKCLR